MTRTDDIIDCACRLSLLIATADSKSLEEAHEQLRINANCMTMPERAMVLHNARNAVQVALVFRAGEAAKLPRIGVGR